MSKPIATIQSTSATLPTAGRKIISGVNVAGILGCILPHEIGRDDVIRARNVKLSYEMAHSAITGQKSPLAFVQGLAFCAVVFSHGNKSLAQLQAGAPAWVQSLLANVTQHFKCGAGTVTRSALETALDAGIKLTLALPAPAKAVKDTANGKVITSTSTSTSTSTVVEEPIDLATGRIKVHSLAFGHEAHEENIRSNDVARIQAGFARAEELARREAAKQKADEDLDLVRIISAIAVNRREFAIDQLRAAAAAMGFELRKSLKAA